jgi:outer membrane protein assembly factor BamB
VAGPAGVDLLECTRDSDPSVRITALEALVALGRASPEELATGLKAADLAELALLIPALRDARPPVKEALSFLALLAKVEEVRHAARAAEDSIRGDPVPAPGERPEFDWPQWRGPRKDNVSLETGLLKEWPEAGPPLAWEVWGIGDGIAAPSVSSGRVFVMGHLNGWEYLTALDSKTGRCLWMTRLGPAGYLEVSHMRWALQRTPTADAEQVFPFLSSGQLVCLRARDGVEEWRIDYGREFGTRWEHWGYCDHPMIDGGRLLCIPASEKAMVAAVDRRTGRVLWKSRHVSDPDSAPSSILADLGGTRQIVVKSTIYCGFSAQDGKLLWMWEDDRADGSLVRTPMLLSSTSLLIRHSWNRVSRLQLSGLPPMAGPVKVYARKQDFGWLHDSSLVLGNFLYADPGFSVQRLSVEPESEDRKYLSLGSGYESSMTCADGQLYVLSTEGTMALVDVNEEIELRSKFSVPMFVRTSGTTNPIVAQGRLYIRDSDRILCFDVREGASRAAAPSRESIPPPAPVPGAEAPRAAFVPTPQDVVQRMLDLVPPKSSLSLVDLGSGDGRIVLAAAKRPGITPVGYEIEQKLVDISLSAASAEGLSDRVRFECRDFFTVDLSSVDVVMVYLPEEILTQLKPQFAKLKPGARIISHQFRIPGLRADREQHVHSSEDNGEHAIYVYEIPER